MVQTLLPQKLRMLRKKRNLRQEDVARKLHMERSTYCNYENGTRTPSLEILVQLADFFTVPIEYLIREDNQKDLENSLYPLTETEKALINIFRQLPSSAQKEFTCYICYRSSIETTED